MNHLWSGCGKQSDGVHGCESASETLTLLGSDGGHYCESETLTLLGSDGGHCCESASVKTQQGQQQQGTASGDAHDEEKVNGGDAGENANGDGNDEEKVNGGGHSDHDDHSHDRSHDHSHDLGNGNEASVRRNGSIQSCGRS